MTFECLLSLSLLSDGMVTWIRVLSASIIFMSISNSIWLVG